LDDAHQDVAAMLLGAKFLPDALRDSLLCGASLEEIGDQGAKRGACSRTRRAAGLSVAPSGRTRVNRHLTGALSIATGLRRRETGQQESAGRKRVSSGRGEPGIHANASLFGRQTSESISQSGARRLHGPAGKARFCRTRI
jgi:hypothetical protein